MNETERLILVVDDEEDSLSSRLELLRNLGYSCIGVNSGHQALTVLREKKPWVILADLVMPHMSGIELLKAALEEDPDVVVVIYTGYASIDSAKKAIREGAFDYIPKPFSSDDLRIVVERALKYAELTRENSALRSQIEAGPRPDKIVGTSDAIKRILEQVRKVARTSANVMVTGESGTGKELVARAIHYYSSRAARPFVAVDCAALPENLLESELFGYERGAFTGAVTTKEGLIEIAHGGTLFLDEIAEMSYNLQGKLLRVLEELEFRRLGGKKLIGVDIRVVSATNIDPEEAVASKRLRHELYYRLCVVNIKVPPLRERAEDIPLLAYHFLREFSKSNQIEVGKISNEALLALQRYHWPGNVRELQNAIEHAVSMSTTGTLELRDLPEKVRSVGKASYPPTPTDLPFHEAKEQVVQRFEREYLERLIRRHGGNISRAAEAAGLNRKTIYRMLEEHNLSKEAIYAGDMRGEE